MDFLPEALFHALLGLSLIFIFLEVIEVSQHAHYIRHTMVVKQAQEFECFHLKADRRVNQQQCQVDYLRNVDHRLHIRWTFEKGDALVAIGAQRDSASNCGDLLLREMKH